MELIVASGILVLALVPALRLTRDGIKISRQLEISGAMATLCVSKLEEQLALSAANWGAATASGTFAPDYSMLHFHVSCSDALAAGGMPGSLLAINVTVWEDTNGDSAWNNGELRVQFASTLAKTVSYEYEAQGL